MSRQSENVGRGIYDAEDLKLGRRVALKFLPEELANKPEAPERIRREGHLAINGFVLSSNLWMLENS